MKKVMFFAMLAASVAFIVSCSKDDPFTESENYGGNSWNNGNIPGNGSNTPGGNGSSAIASELATFDISLDAMTAEPTEAAAEYFPDEEDQLENNEFTTEVAIDLSNPTAKTENGVEVSVNGGHVTANHGATKKVCYVVSGTTTNGSLTILGDKKYAVRLSGVNITNPDSAALNLLSGKRAYVILTDGTTNTLTDGTGGSQKGALYCKGKLLFNGSGSLSVTGNTNNGIHSADYIVFRKGNKVYVKSLANHGIKANDGIFINGGILNVEVSAAAAKGINCESHIIVNGGRTTVLTSGNGIYDTEDQECKGAAGIKADSTLTVNAGELWLKSTGSGGKGINVDMEATFNGGSVNIVTTGGQFKSNNDTSSPKGIKADGNITVNGGTIIAVGGLENGAQLTQACYQASSWTPNTWYALTVGNETFAFQTPSSGGSGLVVSGASQPTLTAGVSLNGGNSYFGGLGVVGSTVSGGFSVSLSSYSGGNGMGGGPGGWR